ncbi:MAG TPA: hypothetical protein VFO16_12085 [Pseudonocardiaceae bacterium]|nr:hypothetical protein [Pseudonocardiaceae bacterium]
MHVSQDDEFNGQLTLAGGGEVVADIPPRIDYTARREVSSATRQEA